MAEMAQKTGGIYYISPADAGANGVSSAILIRKIRWVGDTTIGDSAALQDLSGNTFYQGKSMQTFVTDEVNFKPPLYVSGMTVATLSSGNIYVYCQ